MPTSVDVSWDWITTWILQAQSTIGCSRTDQWWMLHNDGQKARKTIPHHRWKVKGYGPTEIVIIHTKSHHCKRNNREWQTILVPSKKLTKITLTCSHSIIRWLSREEYRSVLSYPNSEVKAVMPMCDLMELIVIYMPRWLGESLSAPWPNSSSNPQGALHQWNSHVHRKWRYPRPCAASET